MGLALRIQSCPHVVGFLQLHLSVFSRLAYRYTQVFGVGEARNTCGGCDKDACVDHSHFRIGGGEDGTGAVPACDTCYVRYLSVLENEAASKVGEVGESFPLC